MQLFLSNKKGKELLYEETDMNDVLNEFLPTKNQEASGFGLLFKDNIIGEFTKLGGSLLNYGLGAMKKVQQKVGKAFKTEEEIRKEEELKKKLAQKELTKKAVSFFRLNTCTIETLRDDKVYTIYFPKLPCCQMLPKDVKQDFNDHVIRTSSKTKLTYLVN